MAAEIDYYVLQGFYGTLTGWEDLTAEDELREVRKRRKEYRENVGGVYRVQVVFKSGRRAVIE